MKAVRRLTSPLTGSTTKGDSVGGGRCASSWSDSCSVSGLGCSGSTIRSLIGNADVAGRELTQPVLGPAARDELFDLGAHLDLLRPRTRAFLRPLCGRVDAELAADELPLGRMVEVVERSLAEHDVALRVDVRPRIEEHL